VEEVVEHPNVHMHFTPTYSSWLDQIEPWFAKIERDVIAREVFTSVPDLKRKLMRYIATSVNTTSDPNTQTREVEVLRSRASHYFHFNC
jgi:transposase